MFEIKNVSKKYNTEYAVRDLNIEIGDGLNFIIGSSGSGKSTLLKILSGLENDYDGEVLYCGESIKKLNEEQKSYYYNNKFGFIYQDFNLIEDMTVEENILLPLHLKNINGNTQVEKILRSLKITSLRDKKVKLLSGGQKQRVAIARELVKNPDVIIADEPTSALDPKTAIEVMQILRTISKERTVIVVTHDTSLIDDNSKVYELDKGELISKPDGINIKSDKKRTKSKPKFDLSKAMKVGTINIKSRVSKSVVSCLSIVVSAVLLMTSLGGSISSSGDKTFQELFAKYGNTILDISVVSSFMGASGTGGGEDDGPSKDVDQNISGIYEKYINDERVEYIVYSKAIDNISIQVDGKTYQIEGSGSVPVLNNILAGTTPKNKGEVVVPNSFVKNMGISNEEVLGKEIDLKGAIFDHSSGQPIAQEINIKAKVCGVADTTSKYEYDGNVMEYDIPDSFFFDKDSLNEMYEQANINEKTLNFTIRVKDPKSLVDIKNELNAEGIVPLGQFELVEDLVNLEAQTNSLSKGSTMIISTLAIVVLVAISLVTSVMRKREYAIYKVCGYSNSQLSLVSLSESLVLGIVSAISIVVFSPVINILTKSAFGTSITNISSLGLGIVVSLVLGIVLYIVSSTIAKKVNPLLVLKSGGR